MVHGRMHRDDHVGVVRFQPFLDASAAGDFGVNVGTDFIQFGVGQMVEHFPLQRMRRHVFVRVDECAIGQDAVISPEIRQLVGAARILKKELLGQSFGTGSVTASSIG